MGINEARGGKVPAPRPIRAQVAHKTNAAADLRFRLLPKSALQNSAQTKSVAKGPLLSTLLSGRSWPTAALSKVSFGTAGLDDRFRPRRCVPRPARLDPERPYDRANSAPESGHLRRCANANNAMALPSSRFRRESLDEPVKILMTVEERLHEHALILAVSTNVVDIVGQA